MPVSTRNFLPNMARAEAIKNGVDLPAGLTLGSELERRLWAYYTSARGVSEWRDVDLYMIHELIQWDVKIRKVKKKIDETGELTLNSHGNPVVSPWIEVLAKYDRVYRAKLSFLQASLPGPNSTTVTAHGQIEAQFRDGNGFELIPN